MENLYTIPPEYYYRCAFPRGRLLTQMEDDLTAFVQIIVRNRGKHIEQFNKDFDTEYSKYRAGKEKTIENYRTEMITLFGLVYVTPEGIVQPSERTLLLWDNQDFYLFFKSFADKFQFPNAINSTHFTIERIQKGIKIKPASFILKFMKAGIARYGKGFSVTGSEVSNLIFNDLRVTTGKSSPEDVLDIFISNRNSNTRYESGSNPNQHGREFMGYLVLANLVLIDNEDNIFKLNLNEESSIESIINNEYIFNFPADYTTSLEVRKQTDQEWELWYGSVENVEESRFTTPVNTFQEVIGEEVEQGTYPEPILPKLKNIGDLGENIVLKYEKTNISAIRPDKVVLVAKVSHDTTLGYDIQSLELDDISVKKHIEVKTTIRTYPPDSVVLTWFPMSANEWSAAKSYGESYYIYRVFLVSKDAKLFIVKNPAKKEQEGLLTLEPTDYKVILNNDCGQFVEIQ